MAFALIIPAVFVLTALPGLLVNALLLILIIFGDFIKRSSVEAVYAVTISQLIADEMFLTGILFVMVPSFYAQVQFSLFINVCKKLMFRI